MRKEVEGMWVDELEASEAIGGPRNSKKWDYNTRPLERRGGVGYRRRLQANVR
jgi:hypothetical protein